MKISMIMVGVGLSITLSAAALLFFGYIESGIAAMVGIVGIALIGASGAGFAVSHSKNSEP